VREVQAAFGFRSVQTAREHLEILVSEGKLTKVPGVARGYRLPQRQGALSAALVPLLGQVQAGELTWAVEDPDDYIVVEERDSAEDLFALKVRGDSMNGAGILHGDIVVVRRQPDANSGDVVVALVEDEATVKRLRRRNGRIELHPKSPRFKPIIPEPNTLSLLGKVIEVRRYLSPQKEHHHG
jgi:repressor LexA